MNEEELKKKYGTNNLGNPDIDEDDFMSEEDKIMEEIKLYGKDKNYPIIERIQGIIQKGKLEQKKEELERVKKLKDKLEWYLNYQGSSKDIEKYLFNWLEQIFEIKQLQEEIGGMKE